MCFGIIQYVGIRNRKSAYVGNFECKPAAEYVNESIFFARKGLTFLRIQYI
jgi:hypothetical protein